MMELYDEEQIRDGATFDEALVVAHMLQKEVLRLRQANENNLDGWMQHAAGLQRRIKALEDQNALLKDTLEDYDMRLSKVLDEWTGGKFSKTNYTAEAMCSAIDDHVQDLIKEAIKDDREGV